MQIQRMPALHALTPEVQVFELPMHVPPMHAHVSLMAAPSRTASL
jgi:hypothetical protein